MAQATYIARKGCDADFDALTVNSLVVNTATIEAGAIVLADNEGITIGTGADVIVKWDSTNLLISASADDTLIEIGDANATQKSFDLKIYGDAANGADYLFWDASGSALLSAGKAKLQIGESTTGVTAAGGTTMIYGYAAQKTTPLTGTLRGVRGNAVALVDSADGTAEGVTGRAGNAASATDVTGCDLDTARGGSFLVVGAGLSTAGPAVLEKAQGIYAQLDIDAANLTVSDARGLYINVQSGSASANTLTACNLAYLEYESVVGTAPAINSAIKIAGVGGYTPATSLIDASTFQTATHDTDQVTIMKFLNDQGKVVTMSYDRGDTALKFATAS